MGWGNLAEAMFRCDRDYGGAWLSRINLFPDVDRNAGTDFIAYGPTVHALIPYKYQLTH